MNYTYLKLGDQLPAVAVLQKLLKSYGAQLVCDGIFGDNTKWALRVFQRDNGLLDHGRVDKITWARLTARKTLKFIDCVGTHYRDLRQGEINDFELIGANGDVILTGEQSGAATVLARRILQFATGYFGQVFLLRLHGHGGPGDQDVSGGYFIPGYESETDLQSVLRPQFIDGRLHIGAIERTWDSWQNLRPIFSPFGSIQFMGCYVGAEFEGRRLLTSLARIVGVPVSGGIETQMGGGNSTFSLEGTVRNAFPAGLSLQSWARNLPDFESYSE